MVILVLSAVINGKVVVDVSYPIKPIEADSTVSMMKKIGAYRSHSIVRAS